MSVHARLMPVLIALALAGCRDGADRIAKEEAGRQVGLTVARQGEHLRVYLDDAKQIDMHFVEIKAGSFLMGCFSEDYRSSFHNDAPSHMVTLTRDYWI